MPNSRILQINSADNIGIIHTLMSIEAKLVVDSLIEELKFGRINVGEYYSAYFNDFLMPRIAFYSNRDESEVRAFALEQFGISDTSTHLSNPIWIDSNRIDTEFFSFWMDLQDLLISNPLPTDFEYGLQQISNSHNALSFQYKSIICEVAKSSYIYWYSNRESWVIDNDPVFEAGGPGKWGADPVGSDVSGAIQGVAASAVTGGGVLIGGLFGALISTLWDAGAAVGRKFCCENGCGCD